MGSSHSVPAQLTRAQAKKIAGDQWDEGLFQQLPKDSKGRVKRDAFLALDGLSPDPDPPAPAQEDENEQDLAADPTPSQRVPLVVEHGRYVENTKHTRELLREIGGGDRIRAMTALFYDKAFIDVHLDKFIESHDDPHGDRLGNWIVEKMGGEGKLWSNSRPPDARQIAHFHAWNSTKREPSKRGRHFKVDDSRIWMRLMFWSARETGLASNTAFFEWYIRFIRHFIGIYERRAQQFAKQDAAWSADIANLELYIRAGHVMTDLIP